MRYRRSRPMPRTQGGAALIVALLVFALCASLVVAMQTDFYRYFQRSSNLLLAEQARAYLRGAEDLAALALQRDFDDDQTAQRERDDLNELWAQQPQPLPLDELGWLRGEPISDLQGRFNLNWLYQSGDNAPEGQRFTPAQRQFIRLLQALPNVELSQPEAVAITEAVTDWMDPDQRTRSEGAEDDYYGGLEPAYRTANTAMSSVSELRAIANVTPAVFNDLQYLVTVWPQSPAPVNIHTAPLPVLRSINENGSNTPLSEQEGQDLLSVRTESGFADVADFLQQPVFSGKELSGINSLLGETSSYFLLHAWVDLADRNVHLYSVLERQNRLVRPIARAGGSLAGSSL